MKKIICAVLLATAFNSMSQSTFNIEGFYSINNMHNLEDDEYTFNNFGDYGKGAMISYSFQNENDFVVEPIIGVGFIKNEAYLLRTNNATSERFIETTTINGGVNLLRKMGSHFSVGGGIHGMINHSKITDYNENEVSRITVVPTIPVVLRLHVPMGKKKFHWRVSMYGHLSWKPYVQASIGFGF